MRQVLYYDDSDKTWKIAEYDWDDVNQKAVLVRVSDIGFHVDAQGKLCIGKESDGSASAYFDRDNDKPVLRFGPNNYVGPHKQKVSQVVTQEVVIDSGASLITTGEDGTPLHITFVKAGNSWQMKIEEMTDDDLNKRGLARGQFKGKHGG